VSLNANKNNLTPLTGYWCLPNGQISDVDRQVLTDLYLPLLGTRAFGIYQLLWQQIPNKQLVTDRQSHSILLSLLDMDINTFYQERLKLEALSLVSTYSKTDEIGTFNIYQLFPPYSPKVFFEDDLMSIFLLEKIGEDQYSKLVDKYHQSESVLDGSKNVSKTFMQVFQLSDSDIVDKPNAVQKAQTDFNNVSKQGRPQLDATQDDSFDFELICERVEQVYQVSHENLLENQQLLLSLHEFYGVPDVSMIEMIGKTVDITTNEIDPDALKRLVQNRFERKANLSARVEQAPVEQSAVTTNSNDPERLLLQRAKTMPPADFLADEKNRLGGFTGNSEARALRTLSSRSLLPIPVLNILVHYILQNSPTLTLAFMETVANDWKQNNVTTPEAALKRITEFQNRPRKNNNQRRYSKGPRKVEQATDWTKVKSKPVEQKNDSQLEQNRLEMLRKLRNKGK
jgi:replication initiation and membrane attachment protein